VTTPLSHLGPGDEFDLIRRILAQDVAARSASTVPDPRIILGPGDDAAVITGDRIVLTIDAAVEDVHFRRAWLAPDAIGYRSACAALSDLAAMAARPIGLLVTIAVNPADGPDFASAVMAGVSEAAATHGAALLGGDVSQSSGPLMVDVVAAGESARPLVRSGARPGDALWVTGVLGGAAAAVRDWERGVQPTHDARQAFARPRPRIAEALWLAQHDLVTALIDLSDGLAGDAGHLAAASGVRIALDLAKLPVSDAARESAATATEAIALALAGGEDYELCFTTPAGAMEGRAEAFERTFGTRVTHVGTVREGKGVTVIAADGAERPLELRGFSHFTQTGATTTRGGV